MTAAASVAVLRLGTRRSALAMAQSTLVADALHSQGCDVELVGVSTGGDRSAAPLTEAGGLGVFVADLRTRLLAGDVDVVVHSLKDLPTQPAPGLLLVAVPPRADPRDALVARDGLTLAELPLGSSVGTGSPRRAAQLRARRPDLDVRPIRGNVDTRIGSVLGIGPGSVRAPARVPAALDAVVVAAAGLARLGRLDAATELLSVDIMLPAPGQGALAIECRDADGQSGGRLHDLLARLDDQASRAAVTAERALLAALEAGCSAPVGALAQAQGAAHDGANLHLSAAVVSVDGATVLRMSADGPATEAETLGRHLAAELLAAGAGEVMGQRT